MELEHKARVTRFTNGLNELVDLDGHEFTEKFIRINKIFDIPISFLYDSSEYKKFDFIDALKLALLTGCKGFIIDDEEAEFVITQIISEKDAIVFAHLLNLPWTDVRIDSSQKNKFVDIMHLDLKATLSRYVNEKSSVYLRHAKEMMFNGNSDNIEEKYFELFGDKIYEAFVSSRTKF